MVQTAWRLAVVGAGPAGLALALHASRLLPHAQVTLFDACPAGHDPRGDPRTLAMSLGSVQFLRRLQAWPSAAAEPITEVMVSQMPPTPVSYTHLDVYKRQRFICPWAGSGRRRLGSYPCTAAETISPIAMHMLPTTMASAMFFFSTISPHRS